MHGNPRDVVVHQSLPCFFDEKMNRITLTRAEALCNVSKYLNTIDEQWANTNLRNEATSAVVNHVMDELKPFGDNIPCTQFKDIIDSTKEDIADDPAYQKQNEKNEELGTDDSISLEHAVLLAGILATAIYKIRHNGQVSARNNKIKIIQRMVEIADPWMRNDIKKISQHQLLFNEKDWQRICFELMDDIRQSGTLTKKEKRTLVTLINSLCEAWDSNQHLQVRSSEYAYSKRDMNDNEVRLLLDRLAERHKQI